MVNSVCGCAAGGPPGVRLALQAAWSRSAGHGFAGQDLEATARARAFFPDIPPSSPSLALFKNGEMVFFMPRHRIEGRDALAVAQDLITVFESHCQPAAV
jgi:putative YphP/YqiW family bacilliredoxin